MDFENDENGMEELDNIYNELIMEHSMNSYNKKKINDANFEEIGHNPNCGDEITLEVKINNGIIEDVYKKCAEASCIG